MTRRIVDPRLLSGLDAHFMNTCDIQYLVEDVDASGQITETWEARHTDIACNVTPLKGKEIRKPDQTYVIATTSIALQGLYTDIKESDRATVSEITYNILLVELILGVMTRLSCEVVYR